MLQPSESCTAVLKMNLGNVLTFVTGTSNYHDTVYAIGGAYQSVTVNATIEIGVTPGSVYRFWSDRYKGHFYTADESEKNSVIDNYDDSVWKYEGVAWYVLE